MSALWEGGAAEYEKALRREYEATRQRLRSRLQQSGEPVERQALMKELEELQREFERRLKGIGRCLFGAQ